jgi:hypothetical protein
MDVRHIFAYPLSYVPGTLNAADLCCGLQEMPPGRPDRRGRVPVPIHHCGVRAVRREAPLSAVRGVPRSGRSTGGAPEAGRGTLMFDPDANLSSHQPGNGVPDIRTRRQVDEQSATSGYRYAMNEGLRDLALIGIGLSRGPGCCTCAPTLRKMREE